MLVRRCAAVLLALLLFSALGVARPARAMQSALDPCTVVAVEMLDRVTSADALPGDFFRFQSINAVTVKNQIVIPERTMGYGTVVIASAAGRDGQAGTLVLEPRYFILPNGHHLGVVLNHHSSSLEATGSTGNAPGLLGAIPFAAVGAAVGLFDIFHKGKNVTVDRGFVFTVFPSDSPTVEKCQSKPSY